MRTQSTKDHRERKMAAASPTETHRSFTVRVPMSLYLEITQLAEEEETNINKKVTQLIRLGMGKHISLNDALRHLLVKTMTEEPNSGE